MLGNSVNNEKADCTNVGVGVAACAAFLWGLLMCLVKISIVDDLKVGSII
jgi:hypothetical protein